MLVDGGDRFEFEVFAYFLQRRRKPVFLVIKADKVEDLFLFGGEIPIDRFRHHWYNTESVTKMSRGEFWIGNEIVGGYPVSSVISFCQS